MERVYASAFHTEAALVRPQITCGTHALAIALSANLLPGDEMLAISGKPYDTLEAVSYTHLDVYKRQQYLKLARYYNSPDRSTKSTSSHFNVL